MSEPTRERLYELLPAIHRIRDAAAGQPLRALLGVAEAEAQRIEDDIRGLYENWFIETCEDWVVPYIAELLGIRRLPAVGGPGFNQRTHVANTLSYRRRKGTQSLLADLARDVTGWPVRVVEMLPFVGMSQHFEVVRPQLSSTLNLRDAPGLARLQTPFDSIHRTADVRRISEDIAVRHNVPNEAVFVWRLQSYRLENAPAGVIDAAAGQYTFSVLGDDVPLYNQLAVDGGIRGLEAELPVALRRAALDEVLEMRRVALADGRPFPPDPYFDPHPDGRPPVFTIFVDGQALAPEQIVIANLGRDWNRPPAEKVYQDKAGKNVSLPIAAVVDPRLGRMALAKSDEDTRVHVSYSYGFGGDIGAGPYDVAERAPFDTNLDEVATNAPGQTLADVLSGPVPRIIEVRDNEIHEVASISVPSNGTLTIRAQNGLRPVVRIAPNTLLRIELGDAASLDLDGLLFAGGSVEVVVATGGHARLTLRRCTLRPDEVPLLASGGILDLTIDHCITADVDVRPGTVTIHDCIVHGAIDTGTLTMERSTVLRSERSIEFARPVNVDTLEFATDTIFHRKVFARFAQRGCMRHGYVGSSDSITPTRFRCQPDLATSASDLQKEDIVRILKQIEPRFTSTRFGHPGYGQLRRDTDEQIRRGASDGGEMGAFQSLHWLQREENLRAALNEYLRFGYDAGIFYVDEEADVAAIVDPAGLPYIVRIVPLAPLTAITHDIEALSILPNTVNVDLRNATALSRVETPFERLPRSADRRRIAEELAVRHNLPNTAVFVWRLESYRIDDAPAGVIDAAKGHYTFSIVGIDEPLFNPPATSGDAEHELPVALRRSAIEEVVEGMRQGNGSPGQPFFGAPTPAFEVFINGQSVVPEEILIVDLSEGFIEQPRMKRYGTIEKTIRVAVDPETGRFVVTNPRPGDTVRVSYSYGFSGEIGAGPHDRATSSSAPGIEELTDNDVHSLPKLGLSSTTRIVRATKGKRPVIGIPSVGRAITLGQTPLTLEGLLFSGGPLEFVVPEDTRATVFLRHCTFSPHSVPLKISGKGTLRVVLDRCITGDITIASGVTVSIAVRDSILDGTLTGGTWLLERATVFGQVKVESLEFVQDTIFTQLVEVDDVLRGEIRFSYLEDENSITPVRTSCQPDLAIVTSTLDTAGRALLRRQLAPKFTAKRYGAPGFAQLDRTTDERILRGGENRGEMGAFQFLRNHRREQQTRTEYRLNDDTGFFFIT